MASSAFLTDTHRLEQLQDMQKIFSSFGASTPAGKVTFVGQGPVEATPVEQRMIAEWAYLVATEAKSGAASPSYGLGWHREGGIAGFCDDMMVDAAGPPLHVRSVDLETADTRRANAVLRVV